MIALITPTGARPEQFRLCQRWMHRQDYKGDVCWVIVDDAVPITTNVVNQDFKDNWEIIKAYPKPTWTPGRNTQARNIAAGLNAVFNKYNPVLIKAIFIIEDDDYYSPYYLRMMMERLNGYWLLGETRTIYYNVRFRRYVVNANTSHASLFQTAFTPEAIPTLEKCLPNRFIDCVLWSKVVNKHLFSGLNLSVGIKGMPGRGGIGAGHSRAMNMHLDMNMNHLAKFIGNDNTKHYAGYYRNSGFAQYDILTGKRI